MLPSGEGNPFLRETVAGMLATMVARAPDREAIVAPDRRVTYAELHRAARRVASGLLALGVRKNDKIALWLPNRPEWFFVQYGCALIGAVVVALNTRYKAHELRYILRQSNTTTLFCADHSGPVDYLEILGEVLPALREATPGELDVEDFPMLRRVIVDADDPYAGCLRLHDVLEEGDASEWTAARRAAAGAVAPEDPFTILYTSGTTSFPKGAVMSHLNCLPHGWWCGEVMRLTEADRVLHALPLSGTWGGVCIPLATFSHGATLILPDTFEPGLALHLMETERVTVWNGVDSMAVPMLEHPDLARCDRSRLRTGGFAATGGGVQGLFEAVVKRLGLRLAFQPYGMTEVNAMALVHDLDEPPESLALPGVWPADGLEVRVVDPETGVDQPAEREGELWLRGRLVTGGYYEKPEETAKAFTADGWFKTGDLAMRDGKGRVIFRGRLREVLRISHFMVAPGEIEDYLQTHPKVLQAFVIGVPDARTNEAAVAYVIPRPDAAVTEDELIAYCRGRIASFKVPRHVRVVADVPRTPSPHGDKVQKARLREMFLAEG
ncbi:MAG TPA: AMP-binding protein [Methylomirabilota bacterium]|jgi:fatty-acyl-CoA synthase|nr:AMP-binding protein [Methylomirabilota bacterium]